MLRVTAYHVKEFNENGGKYYSTVEGTLNSHQPNRVGSMPTRFIVLSLQCLRFIRSEFLSHFFEHHSNEIELK